MLKKILFINILLVIFYFTTERLFNYQERETLKYVIILFTIITFFVAPSLSSKAHENNSEQVIDVEFGEGEYHNDFSRVGSSHDRRPVKPVDLSGDPIIHARETIAEDLKRIGIEEEKVDKNR